MTKKELQNANQLDLRIKELEIELEMFNILKENRNSHNMNIYDDRGNGTSICIETQMLICDFIIPKLKQEINYLIDQFENL